MLADDATPVATNSKIFIVDDDPEALESLRMLLEQLGFGCEPFRDPLQLLPQLSEHCTGCVVSDVRMLRMSGVELLDIVSHSSPGMSVVLVSAYADVELAVSAMRRGASSVLRKPYTEEQLWEALRKALLEAEERVSVIGRRREFEADLGKLTPREFQVLTKLIAGLPHKQIARDLGWSLRTIEKERTSALEKLGCSSPIEALARAMNSGLSEWPSREAMQ